MRGCHRRGLAPHLVLGGGLAPRLRQAACRRPRPPAAPRRRRPRSSAGSSGSGAGRRFRCRRRRRTNVMLITNVSARPRIRSKVPRWTSSALQAMAARPGPGEEEANGRNPDVRAQRCPDVAHRHQREARTVGARDTGTGEHRALKRSEHDRRPSRRTGGRAEAAGERSVLREKDLRDIGAPRPARRCSRDEYCRHRGGAERRAEAAPRSRQRPRESARSPCSRRGGSRHEKSETRKDAALTRTRRRVRAADETPPIGPAAQLRFSTPGAARWLG